MASTIPQQMDTANATHGGTVKLTTWNYSVHLRTVLCLGRPLMYSLCTRCVQFPCAQSPSVRPSCTQSPLYTIPDAQSSRVPSFYCAAHCVCHLSVNSPAVYVPPGGVFNSFQCNSIQFDSIEIGQRAPEFTRTTRRHELWFCGEICTDTVLVPVSPRMHAPPGLRLPLQVQLLEPLDGGKVPRRVSKQITIGFAIFRGQPDAFDKQCKQQTFGEIQHQEGTPLLAQIDGLVIGDGHTSCPHPGQTEKRNRATIHRQSGSAGRED